MNNDDMKNEIRKNMYKIQQTIGGNIDTGTLYDIMTMIDDCIIIIDDSCVMVD